MQLEQARASIDGSSFRSRKVKNNSNRYQQSSLNSEENQFLREYQNYSFRTIDESPQVIDKSRSATIDPTQSPKPFHKKGLIEELSEKNEMLRREVMRVEKILNVGDHKKEKKLFPQINDEALRQELANAYKQIRMYENDVAQRKKLFDSQGTFVDKIRRAELTLVQREAMVKRLQAQISETKKQSNQFVKLLQDGHIKKEYAHKTSRLHKEIKYYENMLKEQANLELSHNENTGKKKQLIKTMEEEILNSGFSKVELALMKKRFEGAERTAPSQVARSTVPEEDRSQAAYEELKNEMAILKKMQKDYAKKIEDLEKERAEATERSIKSKLTLEEVERDLEMAQQEFANMKKNIDPSKLKPTNKNGSGPNQSTFSRFSGSKNTTNNPFQHRFQVFQAGYFNKKSTPFNDRPILGRKSAKIIELLIFENRTQFLGFQATYLMNDSSEKKGGMNVLKRQNERFMKEKTVRLQGGDYFKNFQLAISKDNVITGIIATSLQGKVVKAGFLQGLKMELEMSVKEFPCCFYGSYSERGLELLGIERVEGQ